MNFECRFATDEACRDYLCALRWPDGFACPRCQGTQGWKMKRGLWLCGDCRHQASVTAGTNFQDSHLPLSLSFRAMWYVTNQKNGASALAIRNTVSNTSFQRSPHPRLPSSPMSGGFPAHAASRNFNEQIFNRLCGQQASSIITFPILGADALCELRTLQIRPRVSNHSMRMRITCSHWNSMRPLPNWRSSRRCKVQRSCAPKRTLALPSTTNR